MKRKGDGSQWQDNGDKTGQWSDSPFCGGRRFIRQGVLSAGEAPVAGSGSCPDDRIGRMAGTGLWPLS